MSDAIFLIREGELVELHNAAYDAERDLQKFLADHPALIAGSQIDSGSPRRWLLVSREMAVPSDEDGARRWSLDHLFLDQDAIPTLIEVKRSTDSRIRREVVGQMLDYAANAVVHWPVEQIIARFEAQWTAPDRDATDVLIDFLQGESRPEDFWARAKTNLQAGKIRLIFVADIIPPELRRIVEFLNTQMDPAEVLALELKQYVGEGIHTLVPRLIGRTTEAERKKTAGSPEKKAWDEASFFTAIEQRNGRSIADVAHKILGWSQAKGHVEYGHGQRHGSLQFAVTTGGKSRYVFALWTGGTIEVYFYWLKRRPPFEDESMRQELMDRLSSIGEIDLPNDAIARRPNIKLSTFLRADRLAQLFSVLDWVVTEIRASGVA